MQIYEENTLTTKPTFLFSNIETNEFKIAKGELKIRSVKSNLNLGSNTYDEHGDIEGGSLSKEQFEYKTIFTSCREYYPEDAVVINSLSSSGYPYRDACRIVSKEIFISKLYYLNTGMLKSEYGNWGEGINIIMVHPFLQINDGLTTYNNFTAMVNPSINQSATKNSGLQRTFAMIGYFGKYYDIFLKNSTLLTLFNKDYIILECTLHRGEQLYDHHYYPRHIGDRIPISVPTFLAWFEEYELYNDLVAYLKTKTGYIYLTELKYNLINNNLSVKFIWE